LVFLNHCRIENTLNDYIQLKEYLIIPEAQHLESLRFKKGGTLLVIFLLFKMLTPIQLDDQFPAWTAKISDVIPDGVLSSEVQSIEVIGTQLLP